MKLVKASEIKSFASEAARQMLEAPLYTTGIAMYRLGVRMAGLSNEKARKLDHGQHEIWQRIEQSLTPGDPVIWVHAASLGEFEQGRPLIERIKANNPEYKVLLTFFSPSGYEVRKNYDLADCVCYLPFDTPGRVRRFIETVRPAKAIFIKYEVWRNYLHALYEHNIPTYLVSATFRPDQKFFKRGFAWYGLWLKWYTRIFVQDERSLELLGNIGVTNVEVTGDTRFDRVANIRQTRKEIPELKAFTRHEDADHPVTLMCGSSWPADEDVYIPWVNAHPEVKVVVAPHEFDDERLARLQARFDNGAVLLSQVRNGNASIDGAQALIIDCFGLLSSAYHYCDIAYVGGGFGVGIHNINEPAVYGVPVIFGPNHQRFVEAREMSVVGCGMPVSGADEFRLVMDKLTGDAAERERRGRWADQYIQSKLGASDKVYDAIFRRRPPADCLMSILSPRTAQ